MYREWIRDFRRCRRNCKTAISRLKNGTLSDWYGRKTKEIDSLVREMLSDGQEVDADNRIPDNKRTNMKIPSDLVAMERHNGRTNDFDIIFITAHIAKIIADVQELKRWAFNRETLEIFFRNPETRAAAGKRFQKMFLRKYQTQDPHTFPPCYELGVNLPEHPMGEFSQKAAMPWKGLGQQPQLRAISLGYNPTDGSLLKGMIEATMDKDSIRFVIPLAENWATWDAALFLSFEKEGKREVYIVFLQTTVNTDHKIYAKGLNEVRDAIPEGLSVHYHYVLVLLVKDESLESMPQIPLWKHVLNNSTQRKTDTLWDRAT